MIQFTAGRYARVRIPLMVKVAAGALALCGLAGAARAGELPEIRLSARNAVPTCATPDRLMAFLKRRNATLAPQFKTIAKHYKTHGVRWGVRWDYAFFQMAIETNFLTYRRPDGRMGDVSPKQNNFAGIGTTGGGVPGDSFPDVSTGVLGQIQHLVAYSGEEVSNPVAQRTQLKQQHILERSRQLGRPVRFSDLAKRWAVDPKYGSSIEWVAQKFRNEFCPAGGRQEAEVLPWQRRSDAKPAEPAPQGGAVRTVWRRDGAKPATAESAPVAKPEASVASVEPSAVQPSAQPAPDVAGAANAVVTQSGTDATSAVEAPESTFALFSPPAALADVTMPSAEPVATVTVAAPKDASAAPTRARDEQAGPPPPPVLEIAMGPLPPPAASGPPPPAVSGPPPPAAMGPPPPPASSAPVTMLAETATAPSSAAEPANFLPPSGLGVKPGRCIVETATFAGETTVLVKTPVGADMHYVALSVLDGFEDSMTKSFLDARPGGGESLGVFPSKDAALTHARTLCPE